MRYKVLELREKGLSLRAIAKELNISPSTVFHYTNRLLKTSKKQEVIDLYKSGMRIVDIANKLGLKSSGVQYHLKGIDKRPVKKMDVATEARKLIDQGMSLKDILSTLKISLRTYYKYVKGSNFVPKSSLSQETIDLIVNLRLLGMKYKDISKDLNVPLHSVLKHARGLNVVHKRPRKEGYIKVNKVYSKDRVVELRNQGMDAKRISEKLNINISTVYAYSKGHSFKKAKVVKPKVITPAIIGNCVMQKGALRKDDTLEVKLRENRDEGRLVKILYSDISDYPSVRAEIRVKDDVSDLVAAQRWGKKYGKKSVKLIK